MFKVSIILACYNVEAFIDDAFQTIVKQSEFANFQVPASIGEIRLRCGVFLRNTCQRRTDVRVSQFAGDLQHLRPRFPHGFLGRPKYLIGRLVRREHIAEFLSILVASKPPVMGARR